MSATFRPFIKIATGAATDSAVGHIEPSVGAWLSACVDATLLALICTIFFGMRVDLMGKTLRQSKKHLHLIGLALVANFVLVPLIGYAIANLLLFKYPLLMVGLLIYFMSPCTDWFPAFTQLSKGNVALGTTLLPIYMVVQLLLYPVYLRLFTHHTALVNSTDIGSTLGQWFVLPLLVACIVNLVLRAVLNRGVLEALLKFVTALTPWLIALLVAEIFVSNIQVILTHIDVFGCLILGVLLFFFSTYWLGEALSKNAQLAYPEHTLLAMTIAARNAPLMLSMTMVALPEQPLACAAITIGILLEFPHLSLLRHWLLAKHRQILQRNNPIKPASNAAHRPHAKV